MALRLLMVARRVFRLFSLLLRRALGLSRATPTPTLPTLHHNTASPLAFSEQAARHQQEKLRNCPPLSSLSVSLVGHLPSLRILTLLRGLTSRLGGML